MTEELFIAQRHYDTLPELLDAVRDLAQNQRQFAVVFDRRGAAVVSTPDLTPRHKPAPQPTPLRAG